MLDLSQEALARRAGISTVFVGRVESTRNQPTINSMQKLAKGLAARLSDLIREAEALAKRGRVGRGAEPQQVHTRSSGVRALTISRGPDCTAEVTTGFPRTMTRQAPWIRDRRCAGLHGNPRSA